MTPLRFLFLTVLLILFVHCAHDGNCNNRPQRPTPSPTPEGQTSTGSTTNGLAESFSNSASPTPGPTPVPLFAQDSENKVPKIEVSKPSGEKQCGMAAGQTLDEMKNTLTQLKIPVYEAKTEKDHLIHLAVCGAPSGKIHVFSIPKKFQVKVLKLGFKPLVR